jgi:hypothetical protein
MEAYYLILQFLWWNNLRQKFTSRLMSPYIVEASKDIAGADVFFLTCGRYSRLMPHEGYETINIGLLTPIVGITSTSTKLRISRTRDSITLVQIRQVYFYLYLHFGDSFVVEVGGDVYHCSLSALVSGYHFRGNGGEATGGVVKARRLGQVNGSHRSGPGLRESVHVG